MLTLAPFRVGSWCPAAESANIPRFGVSWTSNQCFYLLSRVFDGGYRTAYFELNFRCNEIMMNFAMNEIAKVLKTVFGGDIEIMHCASVGGGDIHMSYQVEFLAAGEVRRVFVKTNDEQYAQLLEAESQALIEIAKQSAIKTPQCLGLHRASKHVFLVLEWLDLKSHGDDYALGRQMAKLHQVTHSSFGWQGDNYIGYSKQPNRWVRRWSEFWRVYRLEPQLQLAQGQGFHKALKKFQQPLLAATELLLEAHNPQASLLHGDFWGGNKAFLASGQPVIFDPASYYGDREVDLAMAGLFGGFTQDFYAGYESVWPLEPGFQQRKVLYNLYHQLNHLNMFGNSYLGESLRAIKTIIGEPVVDCSE